MCGVVLRADWLNSTVLVEDVSAHGGGEGRSVERRVHLLEALWLQRWR